MLYDICAVSMPKVFRILNRTNIGGPILNAIYLTRDMPSDIESYLVAGPPLDHEQNSKELFDKQQVDVHYIQSMRKSLNPFKDFVTYWELRKSIRAFKPDIVHTHGSKAGGVGRLAARHEHVPVVVHTFHGHVFHSYYNKLFSKIIIEMERYLAKISTHIVAISVKQKEELSNVYKICDEQKITVVPNGIDLSPFFENRNTKRLKWRTKINAAENDLVICIVGRIVSIKNHSLFIRMAAEVLNQHDKHQTLKFVIVGDGNLREEIIQLSIQLGLSVSYLPESSNTQVDVLLTSWETETDEVFAGSDIVCLTSLNEGTPISLIEAQAAAKPVVSTRVGGVEDTVCSESAFLCESDNVQAFSSHVLALVRNEQLRKKMGEAGERFVMEHYSHKRLVSDMYKLYHQLLHPN